MPQYGEYAPAGYVSAVEPPAPVAANPYGIPVVARPAPGVAAPGRKRRTWDLVLTIILLVLGFFGMILGIAYAAIFSNPEILSQAMSSQGFGTFTGSAGSAPTVLVVSHAGLFLIALGVSIPLLVSRRIVAFWVPLAAGVIAAAIFWTTLASVLLSDPAFVTRVGG
ncbi:hypothetical protein BH10ACT6_BH10ACT6_11470 [soil metagenome]